MENATERRVYEVMFLVDSGDAAAWDDITKHLTTILTRSNAEIIGITRWDERKLAYTVQKRKRGTYVLAFFSLTNGSAIAEIERDCLLSEKVLRCLVLKAEHFSVADMRAQLGEDIHEELAQAIIAERGEQVAAAAVVAKPTHTGESETPRDEEFGGERRERFERRERRERFER
jgi:small subunit ribosomal protein S6